MLQQLGETEREHVPLQSVLAAVGTRVHGTALFILSVPEAVPLPIPSASMIFGMPIIMIAGHLVFFGEQAGLPRRMHTLPVPARALRLLACYLTPLLLVMERVSRPRLARISHRVSFVSGVVRDCGCRFCDPDVRARAAVSARGGWRPGWCSLGSWPSGGTGPSGGGADQPERSLPARRQPVIFILCA
ncbi:exopolysaccharide biosynthesis protein [Propylenella binzhouense]|uniref:Uncharacterized protein n=1 Tax=Propylenella binzhouense TaxID=2555902 RepID=A0A964T2B1_9HYPH|nr:hypothetical protein [Propylenella binzhouense]